MTTETALVEQPGGSVMAVRFNKVAESLIVNDWTQNGMDSVSEVPDETKRLCVLIDIARSLRAIRRQIECPNVRAGFEAMQESASILKRRLPVSKKTKRKAAAK